MKKIISIIAVLLIAMGINLIKNSSVIFADEPIKVAVNGQFVDFNGQNPVIVDGRTLVPVRGVFENLGFNVNWNADNQQVSLVRNDYTVIITIGDSMFLTNDIIHSLDVPAQIFDGRTMLPIRSVLESVGYSVSWDNNTRTVTVISRQNENERGSASMPSINVLTPITGDTTMMNYIDVEYLATPSDGEEIVNIFVIINDDSFDDLYRSGINGLSQAGTLGQGRIFLLPGENQIEITIRDTAGLTATYISESRPIFLEGIPAPRSSLDTMEELPDGMGWISTNRLSVYTVMPDDPITLEQVEEAVSTIDGVVIGMFPYRGQYIVEVPQTTVDGLNALGRQLMNDFPDIFRTFTIPVRLINPIGTQ
jgi:hypothetical protein